MAHVRLTREAKKSTFLRYALMSWGLGERGTRDYSFTADDLFSDTWLTEAKEEMMQK